MVKEITHEILYLPGRVEAPHFFRITTLEDTRLNKELDYTSLVLLLGSITALEASLSPRSPVLPRIPIVQSESVDPLEKQKGGSCGSAEQQESSLMKRAEKEGGRKQEIVT